MSKRFWLERTVAAVALAALASTASAQTVITQSKASAGLSACDPPGFPVVICKTGSYKLTTNLTVPNGNTTAIFITADNVTIDLNGFGIYGPETMTGTGIGIYANQSNVAVMNGSVRGLGRSGIYLDGNSHRVEKVFALRNGLHGIFVNSGSIVSSSTTSYNYWGIEARGSLVSGNVIQGNQDGGLLLYAATGYERNILIGNRVSIYNPTLGHSLGGNICDSTTCP